MSFGGVLVAIIVLCMQRAQAQRVHVVGDSIGWTIPQNGAAAYQTWASNNNFTVGDILSFNFVTNAHDILEVPKESFDSCSSANPIGNTITIGPANITLQTTGNHYYICTFGQHCQNGQKLAITVAATPGPLPPSSTTPPPTTTTPPATPSPRVHVVGDNIGWTIPQNGAAAYQTWASNNNFVVGDILSFNFVTNAHDILEVPKESFDSCSSANPIGNTITTGPANITLQTMGDHYYICTFGQHCQNGQKLAITVAATPGASPPSSTTLPPTTTNPPATPSSKVHVVGDSIGWTIPQNGATAYQTWASNNNFAIGDILSFNFVTNAHDVLEVPKESFDSCSSANPIGNTITTGPTNITLQTTGDHYYICTFGQHCQNGQKLAITVAATPGASPPSSITPPPTITTPPATPSSRVHVVGDSIGWTIPQNGAVAYQTWASNNNFAIGDILSFNFVTNAHDVLEVPKESFDSCSSANPIGNTITTGPTNITVQTTGDHYYICTFGQHCQNGQKLAITVAAAPGPSPPSSITPPPTITTPPATPSSRVHVVGDSIGWTIPQNGVAAYQTWASNNNFAVGDILSFNFVTNAHDVLEVPKESFDSCSSANPIGNTITTGPANITLQTTGDHYYICTFGQHCQNGQKLAITVAATSGPLPPSSSTLPPTATTIPLPNSSATGVLASFFLVLVSIIMSGYF